MKKFSSPVFKPNYINPAAVHRAPSKRFSEFHIREDCREAGVFRAACVDTETDLSGILPHMADPHLGKTLPILRAFDAVIVLAPAEPIPHGFHVIRDRRCRLVRVSMIGDHGAKMLELIIFVFYRSLQPVFRIKIHHDPALVKAVMTLCEIRLYDE